MQIKKFMLTVMILLMANSAWAEIVDIHWEIGPDHPTYRKGGSLGIVDGMVISAAGSEFPWAESAAVYAFSPDLRSWSRLPDVPRGSAYTNGIDAGDEFYLCAGRNTLEKTYITHSDVYRLSKDSSGTWNWTKMPNMITHRAFYAIGTVGTKIIAVGGNKIDNSAEMVTPTTTINNVEWFDTATPKAGWKPLAPMLGHPRGWLSGCGIGDKFYVFGGLYLDEDDKGKTSYIRVREAYVLDTIVNRWSRIADMPHGDSGFVAVPFDNRYILIIGGVTTNGRSDYLAGTGWYNNEIMVYDTVTDTYKTLPSRMPNATNDVRATLIGKKLYVLGGENVSKETSNTTNYLRIGTIISK